LSDAIKPQRVLEDKFPYRLFCFRNVNIGSTLLTHKAY